MASKDSKKNIIVIVNELNEGVTDLYEHLMDDEHKESVVQIDKLIQSLKHLKTNLITKDKV
jgi:hypothetical protein